MSESLTVIEIRPPSKARRSSDYGVCGEAAQIGELVEWKPYRKGWLVWRCGYPVCFEKVPTHPRMLSQAFSLVGYRSPVQAVYDTLVAASKPKIPAGPVDINRIPNRPANNDEPRYLGVMTPWPRHA